MSVVKFLFIKFCIPVFNMSLFKVILYVLSKMFYNFIPLKNYLKNREGNGFESR